MLLPLGTLVNVAAIAVGSCIGMLLGSRFPENIRKVVFQALGLAVLVLGIQMALGFGNPLVIIFALILGGVAGELLGLEQFFASLGDRVKRAIRSKNERFTDGLVTASLIYCIGSMAIVGSFDEGLRGDPSILYTKAMLDGFASIALAATYGLGVLFSVVPVFAYQYGLTLFANQFQDVFSPVVIGELTALGGMLIMGIGINLLELTYIRISNLLPGLVVVVVLAMLVN